MSVAMTEEQFAQLLQTIGTRAAADPPAPQERGGDRRTIPLKGFARMTKFAKGEENWKEWNFDFYVILGSVCPDLATILKVLESIIEETGMQKVRDLDRDRADRVGLEKLARELYEVLFLTTEGEAKMMIRNIADQDGILAWHRLYRHYNRRTLARVLRIHREAMHPKSPRSLENLISDVVEWEDKWARMAKEYPAVPVLWKMAALMELCPNDVQDMVYQTIDDVHEDYEKLKQKILSWVSNKTNRDGPVPMPMEIGEVYREGMNVDAISSQSQCYNCGGWGHASRECPSQKGVKVKGKGKSKDQTKGKGKGYQNYFQGYQVYQASSTNDYKGKGGYQNDSSGTGQGYQGQCHKCGKVGHKAAECRSSGWNVHAVEEEECKEEQPGWEEPAEVDVGTVWSVGHIDVLSTTKEEEKGDKFSITLDSGAGASCWPVSLMKEVEMKPKQPGIRFRAANGEELKYFGRKRIGFRPVGEKSGNNECNVEFHVTNATKPLASALAVVNANNRVVLTKEPGGSFIENIATKKIKLKEVGGTFVFDVESERRSGSSGFKRRA